ncbi:alpha/beta fold hydrolase [Psychrobacter sp. SZ93C1]|uniref:alpha/beta fold hydrolase n=1 Tax=Psychrobacter sp. SZ93C1 TaxID=2792058 RepID=UPI0018CDD196|nr:alpha/beta hydrolase [Psychrobacter sp. SZ93C1]MBH0064344.1 alpha/beta hydrolase [Psychrobacter sp. SZ93C1]
MIILLLPGADGTGVLFEPFVESIKTSINDVSKSIVPISTAIINLNDDEFGNPLEQNLSSQSMRIESQYDDQTVIVIAESYSGLLAYELLSRQNLDISQVIFIASFLQSPSRFAVIAAKIRPIWLKGVLKITPSLLWGRVLFGRWQTPRLRCLFNQALEKTPNQLLQQRLAIIAKMVAPNKTIDVPCLYLQARQDNLVSVQNIEIFSQIFTNFTSVAVNGTHFLLQTNPEAVWQVIKKQISFGTNQHYEM